MTAAPYDRPSVPPALLELVNQVFEVEKKLSRIDKPHSINRNVRRMREILQEGLYDQQDLGLVYHDPLGEPYNETRTDCDASIAGESPDNLTITEVIKPIIFLQMGSHKRMVQKAVVIAQTQQQVTPSPSE